MAGTNLKSVSELTDKTSEIKDWDVLKGRVEIEISLKAADGKSYDSFRVNLGTLFDWLAADILKRASEAADGKGFLVKGSATNIPDEQTVYGKVTWKETNTFSKTVEGTARKALWA